MTEITCSCPIDRDGKIIPNHKENGCLCPPKIAIVSLVYKSVEYALFLLESLFRFTPMLKNGNAEIVFISNDATEDVIKFLNSPRYDSYKHIEHHNPNPKEHYINRVYKAWNRAKEINADILVFVNSDMAFSYNWLENLLKRLKENNVVSPVLVESGKIPSLLSHTVVKNFGRTPKEFKEEEWLKFAELLKEDTEQPMGCFMPCAMLKKNFIGFPEGNILDRKTNQIISGDQWMFWQLQQRGINHTTSFDSCVFHIQGGEMDA